MPAAFAGTAVVRVAAAPLVPGFTLRLSSGFSLAPDGKTFATADHGQVTVRAVTDGQVVRTFTLADNPTLWGWSPDGMLLVGLTGGDPSGKQQLTLWDVVSGRVAATIGPPAGFTSVTWSPDSRYLAWSDGRQIVRWDRQAGQALPQPQPTWPAALGPPTVDSHLGQIAWSPVSSSLAVVQASVITLWDGVSGAAQGKLTADGPITQIAWSPDGTLLAGVLADEHYSGRSVVLWNPATGRERLRLTAAATERTPQVKAMSWLGPATVAVSWDSGDARKPIITLYNAVTGQILQTLPALADSLAGSPDGQTLAVLDSADAVLTLWSAAPGPHPTPPPTGIPAVAACPVWQPVAGADMGKRVAALRKVVAPAPNDAWAVGSARTGYHDDSLIEHWDGSRWTAVHHPSITGGAQRFFGLAAVTPHDVWAVGEYEDGDPNSSDTAVHTLIEHWDGTRWSAVPSPDGELPTPVPGSNDVMGGANIPGAPASRLVTVSADSPQDVWAVGSSGDTNRVYEAMPLIEHWDGTAWRIVALPADLTGSLTAVTVLAANDVWALGSSDVSEQLLLLHWNGTAWRRVPSGLIRANVGLTNLVAFSTNDIWALGSQEMAAGNTAAVALHWDGTRWQEQSPTFAGTDDSQPMGAVGVGHDIWAVGKVILRGHGNGWTSAPVPLLRANDPTDYQYHGLYSVAADAAGLWAVGDDGAGHALLLRAALGPCDTPTSAP